MKFVCSQSDLNTHLSLIGRAVPSRPTHPVLGNALLVADADKGRISLTAFDLSLGICTHFPADVEEGGKITLPAKLLSDIVARLPEGEVSLFCEDEPAEEALATLTSASSRFLVRGLGAQEFPQLPLIDEGQVLHLPISVLVEGLKGTLFAASADETKQVLTGIHLRSQDTLEFAATDGHRLAVVEPPVAPDTRLNADEITIPARALRELERMLAMQPSTDTVILNFDDTQVEFELGEQRLTSRKLEGTYPAYEQLIPHQFSRVVTVERKRLLSSLELVAVLSDQKNNIIRFSLNSEESQLLLSIEARDVGSAQESVPAQISGGSIDIAFNIKYLMDGLKALPANDIQMKLNEANQPVVFMPLGGVKMTYLVMPVQIRQ
ncbi:MAG: DNA polymerase III subunit beta [Cyanophyceae cyanobacterium]